MNDERAASTLGDVFAGDSNRKDALGKADNRKEPRVQNPREFDDAHYAALMSRAHSDQARALVDAVTERVAVHELAAGKRSNTRKQRHAELTAAVERFLADLLQAQRSEKAKGYVYRPMRPESFSDSDVGYRVFRRLVITMADLGLLEIYKGFQTWGEPFGKRVPEKRGLPVFGLRKRCLTSATSTVSTYPIFISTSSSLCPMIP